MGKSLKAKKRAASLEVLASSSCPLVEFVFDEPLIQVACHPEQPIVVCAIATGHVFCCKYDAAALKRILNKKESALSKEENQADQKRKKFWKVIKLSPSTSEIPLEEDEEKAPVEILWKTRRHKGSVRGLCFNGDGSELYTIGIDRVLKKADTMTGKVVKKVTLPLEDEKNQYTKLVRSQTHPFLLLGDERGNIYTLNSETLKIQNTIKSIHNGDAINDIFQFVGRSVYKFISLGQTTLAFWDSRESNESDADIPEDDLEAKRKVYTSDDQEDEMICGTFVNPDDGDVLVCGMGEGVLTVWKPKKNDLVDQVTRIPICKNESIDCIISSYQDDNCVYCGCSNGNVYKVNVKLGKVVEIRKHSSLDEVYFIDLDHEYRVLSAGMDKLKLWDLTSEEGDNEKPSSDQLSDAEDGSESFSDSDLGSDSDSDSDSDSVSNSDSDSDADSDSSSDEETSDVEETLVGLSKDELLAELDKDLQSSDEESKPEKKRAKKPQPKNTKKQKKELNNKQLRNLQTHEHGIKKFEGL